MTKRTFAGLAGASLLFFILLLLVNGCKKQDQGNSVAQMNEQAKVKEAIKNQLDREGRTWEIPVRQSLEAFYSDAMGNRIPRHIRLQHSAANRGGKTTDAITSSCDYSNTPAASIISYSLNSNCVAGTYIISWTYTVSS